MEAKTAFFYLFSVVLLFAAFRVVTARNAVHAVLYLMLAFSQASAIWLLLEAEFLAITLVLVYLGAVMVLFLFVVMMINLDSHALRAGFWAHFPLAMVVGVVIALEMAYVLMGGFGSATVAQPSATVSGAASNTRALGLLLYSHYLYPLEVAAVILLVGIVAAIALTLRRRKDSKFVSVSDQVHVRARERVALVEMPAVQPSATKPSGSAETAGGAA